MKSAQYDPKIHDRHSIRLKGHDYAGGGLYFVTICAHRNAGKIFGNREIKEMIAREWESVAHVGAGLVSAPSGRMSAPSGRMSALPYAIMPDHFHGLIRISACGEEGGHKARQEEGRHKAYPYGLGDAICEFKSRVVVNYIAKVKAGEWPPSPGKIWHRNYYEMIVRSAEAEKNIANYIRMNPWKLIIAGNYDDGHFRAIGNPNLLNLPKMCVLCSRRVPKGIDLNPPEFDGVYMSGFHSPPEKEILARLLEIKAQVICCPSWGIDKMRIPSDWLPALEENRMMIMEINPELSGNLASAEERNRFVFQTSEQRWIPYVSTGGMLERVMSAEF